MLIRYLQRASTMVTRTSSRTTGKPNLAAMVTSLPTPCERIGGGQALGRLTRVTWMADAWVSAAISGLEPVAGVKSFTISVVVETTTLAGVL